MITSLCDTYLKAAALRGLQGVESVEVYLVFSVKATIYVTLINKVILRSI